MEFQDDGGTPAWRARQAEMNGGYGRTVSGSAHRNPIRRWFTSLTMFQIFGYFFLLPLAAIPAFYIFALATAFALGWNAYLSAAWSAFWVLFMIFNKPLRKWKLRTEARWAREKASRDRQ
jgi:hypothetical protein